MLSSIFKAPKPGRPNDPQDENPHTEAVTDPYMQKYSQPAPNPHHSYQSPSTNFVAPVRDVPPVNPIRSADSGAATVIGRGLIFKGEVHGKGSLQIDGQVIGTISIDDLVVIGESGRIEGNVQSKLVMVHGQIKGNVNASDKVTINSRGSITGDIIAPRVVVTDGAVFKGRIDMEPKAMQTQKGANESARPIANESGMNQPSPSAPPGPPPQKS